MLWDHFHGGVPRHHILADKNLPAISNWWGGLLLPILTWFLLYRIQIGIMSQSRKDSDMLSFRKHMVFRFAASLVFGILLSVFFSLGNPDLSGYLVLALLPIAFVVPIYRSECLLGFVIGMTYTFGTILPTMIGSIFVLIGAFVYLLLRPGIVYISSRIRAGASSKK